MAELLPCLRGNNFVKGITFQIVSASDFAQWLKSLRTSPKIKILRQYRTPVGDPSGALSTVAPNNQNMHRMYTTLSMHNKHMANTDNLLLEQTWPTRLGP